MNPKAGRPFENSGAILSVSYKAATTDADLFSLPDSVIITTTSFHITGFNSTAKQLFNLPDIHSADKTLSELIQFSFKNSSRYKALQTLFTKGSWNGDTVYHNEKGGAFHFNSTASLVNKHTVVITNKLIKETFLNDTTPISTSTESLFTMFMQNSQSGCWLYDEDNYIVFANKAYTDSTNFKGDPTGLHISEVFPEKLASKLIERNKEILRLDAPSCSEHLLTREDGSIVNFVSNTFTFKTADNKRYIGGQAIDITARKLVEKMHERFTYAVNATSEAIWDLDLKTNEIYRSDAFYKISGYKKEEVDGNLDWWVEKIHPEDKERVMKKFEHELASCKENWQDEYRFQYADGSYRYILDKGFAIYEDKKPIRLIGAIQDITERKQLEAQLLYEQVKKQKLINQATIVAQEKERGMISAELHDNVNQLLMSARLHIGATKNSDNHEELLAKASEYILQAVEEIRGLSRRLNSSIVKTVGLQQSVSDICKNMKQFNDITVNMKIDQAVVDKLTQEQQLVVFRIIQEQSNNIIKYSRASAATISITEKQNQCNLIISDNGIGFDKEKQHANGIGFINIFNRIDAYNGKVEIITYPDNGCTLNITLPYMV
jgi:PAS domain S-box-containing protein